MVAYTPPTSYKVLQIPVHQTAILPRAQQLTEPERSGAQEPSVQSCLTSRLESDPLGPQIAITIVGMNQSLDSCAKLFRSLALPVLSVAIRL